MASATTAGEVCSPEPSPFDPAPPGGVSITATYKGGIAWVRLVFDGPFDITGHDPTRFHDVTSGQDGANLVQEASNIVRVNITPFVNEGDAWTVTPDWLGTAPSQAGTVGPAVRYIVSVTDNGGDQVQVIFNDSMDGTLLDADFLTDNTSGAVTSGYVRADDGVTLYFSCVGGSFNSGDDWQLTRIQAPLANPQSGTVT